jgi:ADP-ribose pyrophosphatase YjhB (NUDIX family)
MVSTESAKIDLLNELKSYEPFDNTEKIELVRFINFLENNKNVYSRNNLVAHLTSSSWIVNKNKDKVFLIHHNIYNCWAPLGGHADDDTNLSHVAMKESQEESGMENIKLLDKKILDISVMSVPEHVKNGKIVPLHFHFDVRYLLEADEKQESKIAEREVSAGKWFNVDEIKELNIDIMPILKRVIQKVH